MVKIGVVRLGKEYKGPSPLRVLLYNSLCVAVFSLAIIFIALAAFKNIREREPQEETVPVDDSEEGDREIEIFTPEEIVKEESSMDSAVETEEGEKTRLKIMQEEMEHIIETAVSEPQKFNIMTFSSEIQFWKPQPVKYSISAAQEAVGYVKTLEADGETAVHDALRSALRQDDVSAIYFLTDGEPSFYEDDQILAMIDEEEKKLDDPVKIHTTNFFGEGTTLLRSIATKTGGVYNEIRE